MRKVLAFFASGGEIDHFLFAQQAMRALGGAPTFVAPINEWDSWTLSPRANLDVKVVLTLDPSNLQRGVKNMLNAEDDPVGWTHTRYRMVYLNYGHGIGFMQRRRCQR